jgi:predicted RNA binding protein YcfA (HicA-like mRNA interferase family)
VSPKLKHLSGNEVIAIFHSFSFITHSQKGSHVKLRREVEGRKQTLTIPVHEEIDSGTLRAIVRQASRYILESDLRPHFYTD